jgi:hypothetical protein
MNVGDQEPVHRVDFLLPVKRFDQIRVALVDFLRQLQRFDALGAR